MHNPPISLLPHHVAIVMDGNGRWAQKRWLPRVAGHKQGVDALRGVVQACVERGIRVLTVFAFWPSYTTEPPPLVFTPYHHFHAVVSTLWLLEALTLLRPA